VSEVFKPENVANLYKGRTVSQIFNNVHPSENIEDSKIEVNQSEKSSKEEAIDPYPESHENK